MPTVQFYVASDGSSPFETWFSHLDRTAAVKVTVAITRLEQGNFFNVKTVGEGVQDVRIDWGPGYRVYFGRAGNELIILLHGGVKQRQQQDIDAARNLWADYKRRRPKPR